MSWRKVKQIIDCCVVDVSLVASGSNYRDDDGLDGTVADNALMRTLKSVRWSLNGLCVVRSV